MKPKKSFIYLSSVVAFLLLIPMNILAQTAEKDIDMTDVITFKSPSPKYKDIHLQMHNGLPRFGTQNQYRFIDKYGGLGTDGPKNTLIKEGFVNYHNMVKMKYMATYFDDIDQTNLTALTRENSDNKKDIHSSTAQQHLLSLTKLLISKDTKSNYFWNIRDEFEAHEIYVAFAADNLKDLRDWSTDFFKDNSVTAYCVTRHKFGPYDFDKSGFWVKLPPHNKDFVGFTSRDDAFFYAFLPEEPFENEYLNSISATYPKILLPMAADNAESFLNTREISYSNRRPSEYIYSAIKVRIVFKELNTGNITFPSPTFTYQFEDPIIEFYKDIALTKKIGEISLKDPIYNK